MGRKQRIIAVAIVLFLSAVAILLVVNPLEQVYRAHDRKVEADAREFLKAVERFYKAFFEYPWEALGHLDPDEAVVQNFWLQELVDKRVIDSKFAGRSSWRQIYITQTRLPTPNGVAYGGQGGTTVYACFDPTSERFQTQADEQDKGRNGAFGCLSNCFSCLPR